MIINAKKRLQAAASLKPIKTIRFKTKYDLSEDYRMNTDINIMKYPDKTILLSITAKDFDNRVKTCEIHFTENQIKKLLTSFKSLKPETRADLPFIPTPEQKEEENYKQEEYYQIIRTWDLKDGGKEIIVNVETDSYINTMEIFLHKEDFDKLIKALIS